jgi:hypothetical protein
MSADRVRTPIAQRAIVLLAVAVCLLAAPHRGGAQSVSTSEREALVRLRTDRGGRAEEVDVLIRQAEAGGAKGLPLAPLTNKIREGLAKGADPARIELVVGQMIVNMEAADRLVREIDPASAAAQRDASVALLAESIGSGLTVDEVRELRRQAQAPVEGSAPNRSGTMSSQELAGAAKGLSFIKEARLPVNEGSAVIAEAVRHGFRSHEILDLGREIKRRESDYRAGRASLRAIRDAIARGNRPEELFRDTRATVERPAATRPEAPADQPERAAPPERPQRPATPERPQRPERPPDRPVTPGERTR